MKSIRTKILISFCILAIVSIATLGIVVSWKLNQSISHQSSQIASDMTTRIRETLSGHYQVLDVFIQNIQKDVRRITDILRTLPNVIANLESMREKPLIAVLKKTAETEGIDFAMFFTVDGKLIASFPTDLADLAVEKYFKSWEFGAGIQRLVQNNMIDDATTILDAVSKHESHELELFGLDERDISGKGAISIISAGIVTDDFGDPLGICLIGKLLNQHDEPLKHLYNITGSASVIYLDTTAIAHAGFNNAEQKEGDVSTLQISSEAQAEIYNRDKSPNMILPLAGESYLTTCSTLKSYENENIGSICVGVPESTLFEAQQAIISYGSDAKKSVQGWIVGIGITSLSLFAIVSLVIATKIVTPIKQLSKIATIFATGNFQQEITVTSNDELSGLADSFREMSVYIRDVAGVADKISDGDLRVNVTPKCAQDVLNNSLRKMVAYVQDVADVAEKISNNNLQVDVTSRSDHDILNVSLQRMVANLQQAQEKIEHSMAEVAQQNWLKTGQAELNDTMRGELSIAALAQNIISYLANYLQARVGTVYLTYEEEDLHLAGSYAYTTRKGNRNAFKFGEGLVGQAALEQQSILFTDVPDDYIAVTSGLGEVAPRQIFVTPFLYEGEVKGVIELGTTGEFTAMQRSFIEQATRNIAIAVNSTQVREKMQTLLEETQQQAEELQAQQEQLRVSNEELGTQAEILRASEQKLQTQQEELRQTNEELGEQTQALEIQQQSLQDKNREVEQARQMIEEKASALELSSKYKSEFLSNMSHELRTPLNSLLILSRLLYENKNENLTDKQIEYSRTIHAAGAELLELINEVLDLSKIEAGKMVLNIEEMSLKGFITYVEQHFLHIAEEKGLSLNIESAGDLPSSIHTDRQRVEQVVKNLLSNAMKFTSDGGIHIAITRPGLGVDLSRSGLNPQKAVAISVSDTGVGIPEEKQRLIFEAFQQADGTTNRKYGGTGLGLSITRELAKLLGGEIQLRSQEGEGSTFTLYLPEILTETHHLDQLVLPQSEILRDTNSPLVIETLPEVGARPSEGIEAIRDDRHEEIAPTDKFLLIIEDDPKFAKILFELAREKGFKGLIAGDGAAGLQLADQYRPVAIILDIGLPGMDGWAVMEKLKTNPDTRHIPVHFMSAQDNPLEALKMGAIGYLTKPVTLEALNDAFNKIEVTISQTTKKLLVVEDNDTMRTSMLELLGGENVEITPVTTGQQAFHLLQSENFDCMVLDLGLADISGFELLEKMKADTTMPPLPTIIYTGKELTKEEEIRLKQHTESIIIKGVKSPERLLDKVTLFLHRVESELPEAQQKKLRMFHDKEMILSDKTILMVDDDIRNVFALSSVLEEKGITMLIGENGKEALEGLKNNPEIDLVLMDIMMPEMDGYEAMKAIRVQPQFSKLPIIALTAKAMKGDRQKCIDAGANDYLSKPIDIDKLLSLLRVWLY